MQQWLWHYNIKFTKKYRNSKSGIVYKKQINPSSPKSHSADVNKFIPNWKPKITLKKGIEQATKWWKSYWEKTE